MANPAVKKVHAYDQRLLEVIPDLKEEQFDFIVDLHKNFKSFVVRHALKKPVASFPKLNLKKYLLVQFKLRKMPDIHIVDRYFDAVIPLGVTNDMKGLDYFPVQKIEQMPKGVPFGDSYYAVVIGGKHGTKIFPAEKLVTLGRILSIPLVLLGGKEDSERGEWIENTLKTNVINLCGKLTLDESTFVLEHASAVLTNDTGLMHIAAALHKPIVSLWGNTVPELGMSPYLPYEPEKSVIIENKSVRCRPCSKIGFEKCPKKHFDCMNTLSEIEIVSALEKVAKQSNVQ